MARHHDKTMAAKPAMCEKIVAQQSSRTSARSETRPQTGARLPARKLLVGDALPVRAELVVLCFAHRAGEDCDRDLPFPHVAPARTVQRACITTNQKSRWPKCTESCSSGFS